MLRHASVVHDELDTCVGVVWILLNCWSGHLKARNLLLHGCRYDVLLLFFVDSRELINLRLILPLFGSLIISYVYLRLRDVERPRPFTWRMITLWMLRWLLSWLFHNWRSRLKCGVDRARVGLLNVVISQCIVRFYGLWCFKDLWDFVTWVSNSHRQIEAWIPSFCPNLKNILP